MRFFPVKTWRESAEIISPSNFLATSIPNWVLPVAVGPQMIKTLLYLWLVVVSLEIPRSWLRVASAVASNFVVFWLAGVLSARELLVLVGNVGGVMVSLYLAIKVESILDEHG